jgi:hypothetical protein
VQAPSVAAAAALAAPVGRAVSGMWSDGPRRPASGTGTGSGAAPPAGTFRAGLGALTNGRGIAKSAASPTRPGRDRRRSKGRRAGALTEDSGLEPIEEAGQAEDELESSDRHDPAS